MSKPKRTITLGHKDGKTMDTSHPLKLLLRLIVTTVVIIAIGFLVYKTML